MSVCEILFFGFCLAFVAVEYRPQIKLFQMKPFSCLPCMSGWMTFLVAGFNGEGLMVFLYFFAGVTIGSIFSAIKMRWL